MAAEFIPNSTWTEPKWVSFIGRIHPSLSPADFTTLAGSVSAFIGRPSRVSFPCISQGRTVKKKSLNLFTGITLEQTTKWVVSPTENCKTLLLYALVHARISITRICMPHRRSVQIRKCFSWCSYRGFRGRGWLLSVELLRRAPYWKSESIIFRSIHYFVSLDGRESERLS